MGAPADEGVRVIVGRRPDEGMADVLRRAIDQMLAATIEEDRDDGLSRHRMILTIPAIEARAMHHFLIAQSQLGEALRRAYADQLDGVAAAAVVGAFVGAVLGAIKASVGAGYDAEAVLVAVSRAADIVADGLVAVSNEIGGPRRGPSAAIRD